MEPMGSGKKIKGIFDMSDATKESLAARTNERWKANRIIPDENDFGTSRRAWFGKKKFQYSASLGLKCICVASLLLVPTRYVHGKPLAPGVACAQPEHVSVLFGAPKWHVKGNAGMPTWGRRSSV